MIHFLFITYMQLNHVYVLNENLIFVGEEMEGAI